MIKGPKRYAGLNNEFLIEIERAVKDILHNAPWSIHYSYVFTLLSIYQCGM